MGKITSRILSIGLPSLIVLILLSFSFSTYSYLQIKNTIFEIGVPILFFVWLLKWLSKKTIPIQKADLLFLSPFIAFFISSVLSYLTSPYKEWPFQELIHMMLFLMLALLIYYELDSVSKRKEFYQALAVPLVIILIYGLFQFFQFKYSSHLPFRLDPFRWHGSYAERVFSTFGNPNMLGNFLVVATPFVALSLFLRRAPRFLIGVTLVLMLFIFIAAQSKGAIVGLGVSCLTAIVIFAHEAILKFQKKQRMMIYGLLPGLSLAILISMIYLFVTYAKFNFSLQFRLFTWLSTWEMIDLSPFLGNGLGVFKILYPLFKRPEIIAIEMDQGLTNIMSSHAENEYLEIWHDQGLVGLGIFIWLVITVITCGFILIRTLRKAGRRFDSIEIIEIIALLSAFCGTLAHWGLDVSVRFVSSGIWRVILPVLILSSFKPLMRAGKMKKIKTKFLGPSYFFVSLVGLGCCILIVQSLQWYQANRHFRMSYLYSIHEDRQLDQEHQHASLAVSNDPRNPQYVLSLGNLNRSWGALLIKNSVELESTDPDKSHVLRRAGLKKWATADELYGQVQQIAPYYGKVNFSRALLNVLAANEAERVGNDGKKNEFHQFALDQALIYHQLDPFDARNAILLIDILYQQNRKDEINDIVKDVNFYNQDFYQVSNSPVLFNDNVRILTGYLESLKHHDPGLDRGYRQRL